MAPQLPSRWIVARDSFLNAAVRKSNQFERRGRLRVRGGGKAARAPADFNRTGASRNTRPSSSGAVLPNVVRRLAAYRTHAELPKKVRGPAEASPQHLEDTCPSSSSRRRTHPPRRMRRRYSGSAYLGALRSAEIIFRTCGKHPSISGTQLRG